MAVSVGTGRKAARAAAPAHSQLAHPALPAGHQAHAADHVSHHRAPQQLPRSAELAACAISQAQADAERAILVELYNATNGIFDADWANLTVPTCSLRQISCDACGAVSQLLAGGAVRSSAPCPPRSWG
jgi:hypothetical protein